jgi:hypothetical protein
MLCEAAGMSIVDAWKDEAVAGRNNLRIKMVDVAKKRQVGGCLLQFDSASQADVFFSELIGEKLHCTWVAGETLPTFRCQWSEAGSLDKEPLPIIYTSTAWAFTVLNPR